MIDFLLNETDDIQLEPAETYPPFCISFTKSPTMRVQFDVSKEYEPRQNNGFRIQFYTEKQETETYKLNIVRDNQELAQNIKIALQTELGEIPGKTDFGSILIYTKHKELGQEDVIQQIEDLAQEIATDITSSATTVQAIVEYNKDAGYFYNCNITIYIYTQGTELCHFTL